MALEQSKKLAHFATELVNVGSKLIHKKGVLSFFQLSDEAMALANLDVEALKLEHPEGSLRKNALELAEVCKGKLDLENKENEEKGKKLIDLAAKGIGLADDLLSYIKEMKAVGL